MALAELVPAQQQAAQHPVDRLAADLVARLAAAVAHPLAGLVELEGLGRDIDRDHLQQRAEIARRQQRHADGVVHLARQREQRRIRAPGRGGRMRAHRLRRRQRTRRHMARRVIEMAARGAPVQAQRRQRQRLQEAPEAALAAPLRRQAGMAGHQPRGQPGAGHRLVGTLHLGAQPGGHLLQRQLRGQVGCGGAGRCRLGRLRHGDGRRRCERRCGRRCRPRSLVDLGAEAQALADEAVGLDQQIGRGAVGRRREAHRQHRGAAVPAAQLAQHWREVGVGREDDELVVVHRMLQQLDHVEHHVDVGAGLALAGHRRAVDDLEAGMVEGRAEALVDLRIEVDAPHQQPAPGAGLGRVEPLGQAQPVGQPADPFQRMAAEALGHRRIQLAQARIDIVEINEEGRLHGVGSGSEDQERGREGRSVRSARTRRPPGSADPVSIRRRARISAAAAPARSRDRCACGRGPRADGR